MAKQEEEMSLEKGKKVTGFVTGVFPFGAFVRVNGAKAYIRKRELTLSGNIDPRKILKTEQTIVGIVIKAAEGDRLPELSIKALEPDPWPEFCRAHHVGDPIEVTVKQLFVDGVLAEYAPGIDGFIPLEESSIERDINNPEDLFWVGDRTQATIVKLELGQKKMELSVRKLVKRLAQIDSFIEKLNKEDLKQPVEAQDVYTPVPAAKIRGKIALADPVLIVDDNGDVRGQLVTWFRSLGVNSIAASSSATALSECKNQSCSMIIVDLEMPGESGLEFIGKLRAADPDVVITVMSGPDLISAYLPQLIELGVSEVFPKPLDLREIQIFASELSQGKERRLTTDSGYIAYSGEISGVSQLAKSVRKGQDVRDRILEPLNSLLEQMKADKAVVFRRPLDSLAISVVAQAGQPALDERRFHLLTESPVNDVILEAEPISIGEVSSEDRSGKFAKLRLVLMFESVIGIPLASGGQTEHALFVFARNERVFSAEDQQYVTTIANLIEVALESQLLADRVLAAGQMMLNGQLASAFGHEVFNRVTALELWLKNASRTLGHVISDIHTLGSTTRLPTLEERVGGTMDSVTELVVTVRDFQQLMRPMGDVAVEINQVAKVAIKQMAPVARRSKVTLKYALADDLPKIVANPAKLQQVFLNLLLNAVQHTAAGSDGRRGIIVTTAHRQHESGDALQIRIIDTGPGIHRNLWNTVFELGYTTREGGSGLGLFIARSVVESLNGTIVVEDSLMQIGTTFLVELPIVVQESPR